MGRNGQRRASRREGARENLVVLIAVVVAGAAGGAALALPQAGEYEATAVVSGGASAETARSAEVARSALDRAGARDELAAALLEHSQVEEQGEGTVELTVRAEGPGAARRLASSYARAYAATLPAGRASPAGAASKPSDLLPAALTGAAVGLLAGLMLALARETLDVRRTSSRTMGERLGMRELGRVPAATDDPEESFRLVTRDDPDGGVASAYERAAMALAFEARRASTGVILVAGTVPEDHSEQVAFNLAVSLAALDHSVAVVELDRASPMLRRYFALERPPAGLSDVARDEVALGDALTPVPGIDDLAVLTAGNGDAGDEEGMTAVLQALAASFELVLVCGPPLLRRGAAPPPPADGLLLAVNLRQVRRSRRPRLQRLVRGLGMPVLGYVLVGVADEAAGVSGSRARSPERQTPPPPALRR